jgi:hypothetical protein
VFQLDLILLLNLFTIYLRLLRNVTFCFDITLIIKLFIKYPNILFISLFCGFEYIFLFFSTVLENVLINICLSISLFLVHFPEFLSLISLLNTSTHLKINFIKKITFSILINISFSSVKLFFVPK